MAAIRLALNAVALLAGSYAVLALTLGLCDQFAISGLIAAAAILAAEGIRYVATDRNTYNLENGHAE